MHAQPGRGIDLDNNPPLLFQGPADVATDHVHASYIQPDHASCVHRARGVFRVHTVSHVGGRAARAQVAVLAQEDLSARRRDRIRRVALAGQDRQANRIEAHLAERGGMVVASERVRIHHGHQLGHGGPAIALHAGRITTGRRNHPVAHHQQSVVSALGKAFHQHRGALGPCGLERRKHLLARRQVDGYAPALVSVLGLEHHRHPNLLCHLPSLVGVLDRTAGRHGNADRSEQELGQLFVLRDGFANGAGAIGFRRQDAPLARAPAKLDQTALVEPARGNPSCLGSPHDGPGAGTQAQILVLGTQLLHRGVHVEASLSQHSVDDLDRRFHRGTGHILLAILDYDLEYSRFARRGGLAERHRHPCPLLQRHRHALQDMRQGGTLGCCAAKIRSSPLHPGKRLGKKIAKARLESRDSGNRRIGRAKIDGYLNRGVATPNTGSPKCTNSGELHGGRLGWLVSFRVRPR